MCCIRHSQVHVRLQQTQVGFSQLCFACLATEQFLDSNVPVEYPAVSEHDIVIRADVTFAYMSYSYTIS